MKDGEVSRNRGVESPFIPALVLFNILPATPHHTSFLSATVNVLRMPVDRHPGQEKAVFVHSSSNKVKGSMYYTAPRAARLIRAGVGVGSVQGIQSWGLDLGSMLSVCPVFSSQNLNWVCVGGSTKVSEHLGAPGPFALLNLRLGVSPRLTEAGSKAKCKDPGAVCKPLVSFLYQILLLPPPRLRVGFPAKHRLWRAGEEGRWAGAEPSRLYFGAWNE